MNKNSDKNDITPINEDIKKNDVNDVNQVLGTFFNKKKKKIIKYTSNETNEPVKKTPEEIELEKNLLQQIEKEEELKCQKIIQDNKIRKINEESRQLKFKKKFDELKTHFKGKYELANLLTDFKNEIANYNKQISQSRLEFSINGGDNDTGSAKIYRDFMNKRINRITKIKTVFFSDLPEDKFIENLLNITINVDYRF